MIGEVFDGRYRLVAKLGAGGMGTVYRAEHVRSGRQVAIKVLLPEWAQTESMASRFEREARAAGFLKHPNLVEVLALGRTDSGALYLVMELVEGDLVGELVERGPLPPRRALAITRQALEGLGFAHQQGFIHRDLKPDNLMVIGPPEAEQVKILDFGLVKLVGLAAAELGGEKLTATGMVYGTPIYMSPEQVLGRPLDHRADLYSLGLVLFEMLTGEPPFYSDESGQVMRMHASAERPRLVDRGLPTERSTPLLEALVDRALAKSPADRYASAGEMIAALDQAAAALT